MQLTKTLVSLVLHNTSSRRRWKQAYKLASEQIKPRVATTAEFETGTAAFQNDVDIWIDATGKPVVNQKSQNMLGVSSRFQ